MRSKREGKNMTKEELIEQIKKALEQFWVIDNDNLYNSLSDALLELED